jgi:hypothetical protein
VVKRDAKIEKSAVDDRAFFTPKTDEVSEVSVQPPCFFFASSFYVAALF